MELAKCTADQIRNDTTNTCEFCDPLCATCGPTKDVCKTCRALDLVLSSNTNAGLKCSCKEGSYPTSSRDKPCEKCPNGCKKCTGPNAD